MQKGERVGKYRLSLYGIGKCSSTMATSHCVFVSYSERRDENGMKHIRMSSAVSYRTCTHRIDFRSTESHAANSSSMRPRLRRASASSPSPSCWQSVGECWRLYIQGDQCNPDRQASTSLLPGKSTLGLFVVFLVPVPGQVVYG